MTNKQIGYNISLLLYGLLIVQNRKWWALALLCLFFGRLPLSQIDICMPEPFHAPRNVQENFVELLAKQEVASAYAKDQLATYKKK